VKKTVREGASKILSDERSEEFIERSPFEKVFSCYIVRWRGFLWFFLLTAQKKERRRKKLEELFFVSWASPNSEAATEKIFPRFF